MSVMRVTKNDKFQYYLHLLAMKRCTFTQIDIKLILYNTFTRAQPGPQGAGWSNRGPGKTMTRIIAMMLTMMMMMIMLTMIMLIRMARMMMTRVAFPINSFPLKP